MLDIITNPIIVSVLVMVVLCLLKMNVYISIIVAGLVCAMMGGLSVTEGVTLFIGGMGGNVSSMFSRLLLGMLAVGLTFTGVGEVLAPRITRVMGKGSWLLLIGMFLVAVACETIITLGAVFTTILIPPLLGAFNRFGVDRRKVCTIIMCGLEVGYVCVPLGYGTAFQEIVMGEMINNGVDVPLDMIWKSNLPIALALLIGVALVMVIFRNPRTYEPVPGLTAPLEGEEAMPDDYMPPFERKHICALIAALTAVVGQLITGSLQLGALIAVFVLMAMQIVKFAEFDKIATDGMMRMAYVTFILMAGCGYANVSKTVGDVEGLVSSTVSLLGGSKPIGAFVMLMLGLVVTMGIGSAWGTVPIVAVIMVPMGLQMGFSISAIIMLISISAVLGDAGSPASDQTLMPTAAFNMDGQHDHIWDTCVPSFICVNGPLLVVGTIAACLM